jgi:hypothetical protein
MTKSRLLRSRMGRRYRANFDVAIRDNNTINQQLDRLTCLRKRCRGQSMLHTSTALLTTPGYPRQFLPAINLHLQVSLWLGESLGAALYLLPAAILVECDDTCKIGFGEALQLMRETALATMETFAARLEFLR